MRNKPTEPIEATELRKLYLDTFARVFPEIAEIERVEKEKGKITDSDLKRIFNIK